MDTYRPARSPPPLDYRGEAPRRDYDRPSPRGPREYSRYDDRDGQHGPYTGDRTRRRSRSPRCDMYDDGYYDRRDRDPACDREDMRDVSRGYSPHSRSDLLRSEQDRLRLAKRSFRRREPYYEEPAYEAMPEDPPYHGESDCSPENKPLKLLLVRGLKESVTEELLAKGLEKLTKSEDSPTGATNGSLRRVLLIRQRETDKSMGFGFAEYHSLENARAAFTRAQELGDKCTISSKTVEVNFPHNGVFPHADFGTPELNPKFTFQVLGSAMWHKYRDERYYASELIINVVSPYGSSSPRKEDKSNSTSSTVNQPNLVEPSKTKKRKAPAPSAHSHLQHWQNKAAELRVSDQANSSTNKPSSSISATLTASASPPEDETSQTFAHDGEERKCCYLCNTALKSLDLLRRHVKASRLHAANLADETKVADAFARMEKAGVAKGATLRLAPPATSTQPQADRVAVKEGGADEGYNDRAALRRQEEAFSAPAQPISLSLKKPQSPLAVSASADAESAPKVSKALNMLQKTGWNSGQGLGDGSGITTPIATSMYAAGVGLGHEGSKVGDAAEEAQRATKGDYRGVMLERTRDGARRRFEGLG